MEFRAVFADGQPDRPRAGDRLIYDRRNGTLSLYRDEAELTFSTTPDAAARGRVFVGTGWSTALTRGAAELYARLGELDGAVTQVEGSFPTLEMWEIIG